MVYYLYCPLAEYRNRKIEDIADKDVHNYLDELKKSKVLDNSYLIEDYT